MIRGLAVTVGFLVVSAVPAVAQVHPGSHSLSHPHVPGHPPVDSATHAALHALLHGSWTGALTSAHGISTSMEMAVAHDSLLKLLLTINGAEPTGGATASDFMIQGDTLHWTHALSGATCRATAVLTAATRAVPATMNGRMVCADSALTFSLRKKTE
jgi:hypothetical protein